MLMVPATLPLLASRCRHCRMRAFKPSTTPRLPRRVERVVVVRQAEVGGEVVKILLENGQPVSPGQPIMIIK